MALSPFLPPCQRSITPELLQRFQSYKLPAKHESKSAVRLLDPVSPEGQERRRKLRPKTMISEEKWGRQGVQSRGKPTIPPTVSYQHFREEHRSRQNSTTPTDRHYADHSIGGRNYNTSALSSRMYRPKVIRLTARSKVVLHHYHPPFQQRVLSKSPAKQIPRLLPSPSPPPKQVEVSPVPEGDGSLEPLALSYGAKLLKAQKVFREFL